MNKREQSKVAVFSSRKKKPQHEHEITASNDLQIMHNIESDQLEELEHTYKCMLEAIKEARKSKAAADKQTAEIIRHGFDRVEINKRRALKIACLWRRGYTSRQIDKIMINKSGYALNRTMAANGRAIRSKIIRQARNKMILKLSSAGIGPRPLARIMPPALGTCSPALVCKIVKAAKLRKQMPLPFALYAV